MIFTSFAFDIFGEGFWTGYLDLHINEAFQYLCADF